MALRIIAADDSEFPSLWERCFTASPQRHPLYQPVNLAYYEALAARISGAAPIDRSFVAVDDGGVVAATRMFTVARPDGTRELSCYATIPVWFFENPEASVKRRQKCRAAIKTELERFMQTDDVSRIWYEDPLAGQELSFFGKLMLNLGAEAVPVVRQVIDLDQGDADLFKHVRKSYKSLINWGRRHLRLTVLDSANMTSAHMDQFRALHVQSAGRETRSATTWALQEQMIRCGEAFAVFAELGGALVSAALFPLSSTYCFYGVSASNRQLFDKPLSHAVLWEAILHATRSGCRWFELGVIQFPGIGDPPPTAKELNISTFKHGFGGRSEPRLSIVWECDRAVLSPDPPISKNA